MAEDDSEIPDTGAVFTFGKSKFGDNAPNKFWIRDDKVVQISCGDEHTGVVAESGKLFMFGSNEWGQLGLGHNNVVNKPSRVKALKKEKVIRVACGRNHTLAATASGKVFGFGNNGEGQLGIGNANSQNVVKPSLVQLPTMNVLMMDAGNDHSMLLTDEGDVYVWGGSGEGQLGIGEDEEQHEPRKLNFVEKATCIACGYYHSAIVTESGKLFTCGEAEGGKLGLGEEDEDAIRVPTEVKGIEGKVIHVACGGSQTIAITEDGRAYSFGDGANGQLGQGTDALQSDIPQQISETREKFTMAFCGVNHSALITKKGCLYTFGDGRHGKLALGDENFANKFKPCHVLRFQGFSVETVSCGGCHTLVCAVRQLQNGDLAGSGYESGQDELDNKISDPVKRTHLTKANHLYDSLDLEGSIGARNRRREKIPEAEGSVGRTLPPLSGHSFRGGQSPLVARKASPPPTHEDSDPGSDHAPPPIIKSHSEAVHSAPPPVAKAEESEKEESSGAEEEEDSEEEEKPAARQVSWQHPVDSTSRALPRPAPRRRLDPVSETKKHKGGGALPPITKIEESQIHSKPKPASDSEKESGLSESEEEEKPKEPSKKDMKKHKKAEELKKAKLKSKKEESESEEEEEKSKKKNKHSEDEEESGSETDSKKSKKSKKKDKKNKKKKHSEDEDESETDSKKSKKSKEKDKKKKAPKKKKSNIFGKKRVLDSDEETEDEESEEESTEQDSEKEGKSKKDKDKKTDTKKSSKKSDKKSDKKKAEDSGSEEVSDNEDKSDKHKHDSEEEDEDSKNSNGRQDPVAQNGIKEEQTENAQKAQNLEAEPKLQQPEHEESETEQKDKDKKPPQNEKKSSSCSIL